MQTDAGSHPDPAMPCLKERIEKAKSFEASGKSLVILKAYRNDWWDFESWRCAGSLPPLFWTRETFAFYFPKRSGDFAAAEMDTSDRRLLSRIAAAFNGEEAIARSWIYRPNGLRINPQIPGLNRIEATIRF